MFWDFVKEELKNKNLSLKTLSDLTELNYRTLQNQIGRNILPDVISAVKIAKALNTTVEFLVTGELPIEDTRLQQLKIEIEKLNNFSKSL